MMYTFSFYIYVYSYSSYLVSIWPRNILEINLISEEQVAISSLCDTNKHNKHTPQMY